MSNRDQERGFLTGADREFLRGNRDIQHSSNVRKARWRIRNRARKALEDFAFLLQYMEPRDRTQMLDEFHDRHDERHAELTGEERDQGPPEVTWDILFNPDLLHYGISTGGLRSTQSFLALLLWDLCEDLDLSDEHFEGLYAELVGEGLEDALGRLGIVADADVEVAFNTRDVDSEELRERFEEKPDQLADHEIDWLIHLRNIEWDEYRTYLSKSDDEGNAP